MSVLSQIVTVIETFKQIHDAVEDVKSFKAKSATLARHISVLVEPVTKLKERCTEEELEQHRNSSGGGSGDANLDDNGVPVWIPSLCELQHCMEDIQIFLEKLSNKTWIRKFLQKRQICDKFGSLNNSILILGQSLILSLQTEFKEVVTEEMKNQWNSILCVHNIVADDLKDLKQDLQSQAKDVAEIKAMVSKEAKFQEQLQTPTENEGHIKYADLSDVVKLHDGKYGPIFKAKHNCEDKMLVVKTFEDNGPSAWKELKEQCQLWKELNFSRFIVHLYGYTIDDTGHMCFVVEYMAKGTLRGVLQDEDKHPLPWEQRVVLARDCAQGLCAIHRGQGKTLLHRAITSTRFMVDENYRAKISDNGFVKSSSKISTSNTAISSEGHGSLANDEVNYLCPEETNTSFKRSIKSEVYKLGIIFYEIASRKKPFQAMEEGGKALEDLEKLNFIRDGKTELPPADTPEDFKDLIDDCRKTNPLERPSSYDVVCRLGKMCDQQLESPVDD